MTTWNDLVGFARSAYKVLEERPDEVRLLYEFDDDRSQTVLLGREVLDGQHEWVQIASPCGEVAYVDLKALLEEVGHNTVAAGVAIMGDYVVLRHSLPLENMDPNEFIQPLALLAATADELEEQFSGGDDY
ncbi:hypothetical protein GCM10012275_01260 [Longimycelium tulufanense]|uniref:YbjN domain-containing protein n=1 Tax=Longimycelium tulufanense TaxID=907463 RepID=A0A8J3C9F3_9PSEU|nr:hypothetical protein [Longimycelium tulufanense]GGM33603.1 hypothetical protein GCM10012275_01260 [Longimycelium tulufanense]